MENIYDIFSAQPAQNHSFTPFDKQAWAAQKQETRESAYAMIDETAMEMAGNGEIFRAYLDVQARFDRYSVNNALLITAQMPEATKLKEFDDWKNSGVYVKKGESGIMLLEPGKEYEREDGGIGVSYDVKKVFDISQTSSSRTAYRSFPRGREKLTHSVAPPLPTESVDSVGAHQHQRITPTVSRDERLLLKAIINNAPCKFEITAELPENTGALYKPEDKTVYIRQGMDAQTIFRCLSLELAHAHMDKGNYDRADNAFSAYCVSYLLCKRNGLDTAAFRFDRVPQVMDGMDSQAVRGTLSKVRDVANGISADMNRVFDAQRRAAEKQRDEGAR